MYDSDKDGLSDDAEILEGTNPALRDSDGDGGEDLREIEYGYNPRMPGLIGGPKTRQRIGIGVDSDGDGLSDMTEAGYYGFSPKSPDSDGDGFSDYDELVLHDTAGGAHNDGYWYRPQLPDSSKGASTLDSDGDGLTDIVEYGVTPTHRADMDEDGLTDLEERQRGTNPLDADTDNDGRYDNLDDRPLDPGVSAHGIPQRPPPDRDGDGLSDAYETGVRLDPDKRDTDGDGLDDGAEYDLGTNARLADSDGDGLSDGAELGRRWGGAAASDPTANPLYSGIEQAPVHIPMSRPRNPGDWDDDGLSDHAEVAFGSDIRKMDTDGDGLGDREEMALGTDPRKVDDIDGDGMTDFEEIYKTHTDRTVAQDWADHDGDGRSDLAWRMAQDEVAARNAETRRLDQVDSDGDGLSDLAETSRIGAIVDGEELAVTRLDRRSRTDVSREGEMIAWQFARPVSDPHKADSDGDGIGDKEEVEAWLARGRELDERRYQEQISTDADGDGLTLYDELGLGSSDTSTDSDGDGVSDAIEVGLGLSPARGDTDRDGIGDREVAGAAFAGGIRTDWQNPLFVTDSDDDGVSDGDELIRGTDPDRDARDVVSDEDGDGLSDQAELAIGSDVFDLDTDDDGVLDGAEDDAGTDPLDPGSSPFVRSAAVGTVGIAAADLAFFEPDPSGPGPGPEPRPESAPQPEPDLADPGAATLVDGVVPDTTEVPVVGRLAEADDALLGGIVDVDSAPPEVTPPVPPPEVTLDLGVDVAVLEESLAVDTDGDGTTDWDEANQWVFDVARDNTEVLGDRDGDGLSDLQEAMGGTDPLAADTDGDGASDGAEAAALTNPLVADLPLDVPAAEPAAVDGALDVGSRPELTFPSEPDDDVLRADLDDPSDL